ncbi:MAG: hypothetical protein ACLRMZ_18780 [Blautia marasmi]
MKDSWNFESHLYPVAAVILSLTLPGGTDILPVIQNNRKLPFLVTGPSDMEPERSAMEQGAADYAAKPHCQAAAQACPTGDKHVTPQVQMHPLQDEACIDTMTEHQLPGLYAIAESLRLNLPHKHLFLLDNLKAFNEKYGYVRAIINLPLCLRSGVHTHGWTMCWSGWAEMNF